MPKKDENLCFIDTVLANIGLKFSFKISSCSVFFSLSGHEGNAQYIK